jgi:hypothetical protein
MIIGFGVETDSFDVLDLASINGFVLRILGTSFVAFGGDFSSLITNPSVATVSSSGPPKRLCSSKRRASVLLRAL